MFELEKKFSWSIAFKNVNVKERYYLFYDNEFNFSHS